MRVLLLAVLALLVAQNIAAEADFALDANGNIAKVLVVEFREPSFGVDD
jgi:hypothetical protein